MATRQLRAVLAPAPADDRRSSGGGDVCTLPGCGGAIHAETDGNGRLIAYCVRCADRLGHAKMAAKLGVGAWLTDEQLLRLLRERFMTFSELHRSGFRGDFAKLRAAMYGGAVAGLRIGRRVILFSVASVARWRRSVAVPKRTASLVDAMPHTPPGALSRELAASLGWKPKAVAVAIHNVLARPELRGFLGVTRERGHGPGGIVHRYYWTGPRGTASDPTIPKRRRAS